LITLGAITLNESLYLEGIDNAQNIAVSQARTLGGSLIVQTMQMDGGRTFTLGTVRADGSITGMWCQQQIDAIKALELIGGAVTLVYRDRGSFNVMISGTNFVQLYQREPVNIYKKYTGSITLIEV